MTGAMRCYGSTRLGGRVLAGFSALLGLLMVASTNAPAAAHLMGHFGFSYGEAAVIVTLIATATWVVIAFFPQLIPALITIRAILFFAGAGAVIGW